MGLELAGRARIDGATVENAFGTLKSGRRAAVSDISIVNRAAVISKNPDVHRLVQSAMERAVFLELGEFAVEVSGVTS
jgi:hypothetical protein